MNPEAFVFIPGDQTPANNNNNNNLTVNANGSDNDKLTIDTSNSSAYNHEAVIQDANVRGRHNVRVAGIAANNNNNYKHYHLRSFNNNSNNENHNNSNNNMCDSLLKQVKFQIEYHFGDTNLSMDNYLLSRMHEDSQYWVPVKTVANLTKIRSLTENEATVLQAIKDSDMLILNEDETKVKRPSFVPPKPKQHKDLRRTVFLYGLSKNLANFDSVSKLCNEFGKVKNIYFDKVSESSSTNSKDFNFQGTGNNNDANGDTNNNPKTQEQQSQSQSKQQSSIYENDGPDRDVALVLMTKRFGGRLIRQSSVTHANSNGNGNDNGNGNSIVAPSTTPVGSSSQDILNGIVPPSPTPLYTHPIPNPNGNLLDFSHLRSCFVVFESQSQANKLVKLRSRAADGIRAMHQYDFNKARKKVAAAKAKGISPVFSPAHIALALSPNHDADKILASTVAITPKGNNIGNNNLQHTISNVSNNSSISGNNLLSPAMNGIPSLQNRGSNVSNDSFISQGSQMSNTNITLPGGQDMEYELKRENFELQRANLTLQQALQQNIQTLHKMQLLYNNNPQAAQLQRGKQHPQHPVSARNQNQHKYNNRGYKHQHQHQQLQQRQRQNQQHQQQQPSMMRRHTFDNRAQSAKHSNQINLHFGDWRNNNQNARNSNNIGSISNRNSTHNGINAISNNNNNNEIRRFTMPVGQPQVQVQAQARSNANKTIISNNNNNNNHVHLSQSSKYRVNKSNPQSMKNETTKKSSKVSDFVFTDKEFEAETVDLFIKMDDDLCPNVSFDDMDEDIILPESIDDLPDLDELFFSLESKEVPVVPSNTPQSSQLKLSNNGYVNGATSQKFGKDSSMVSPIYHHNGNNNHYFTPTSNQYPSYQYNSSLMTPNGMTPQNSNFVPIVNVNSNLQQQQQQQSRRQ